MINVKTMCQLVWLCFSICLFVAIMSFFSGISCRLVAFLAYIYHFLRFIIFLHKVYFIDNSFSMSRNLHLNICSDLHRSITVVTKNKNKNKNTLKVLKGSFVRFTSVFVQMFGGIFWNVHLIPIVRRWQNYAIMQKEMKCIQK